MSLTFLEHAHASASYEEETRIAYITYKGFLNAEASTAVYNWLADVNAQFGTPYGEVFDFRSVSEFAPDNLMEARKKSRRRNLRPEVHHVPVAMVVKDYYQEEILRGPMQNVPENQRKAIVRTMEEAIQFLHDWHSKQPSES